MQELIFDKETAEGLYRIFCGLSPSCYKNAEVYDNAKPNMQKAFEKVIEYGKINNIDVRGENPVVKGSYEDCEKESLTVLELIQKKCNEIIKRDYSWSIEFRRYKPHCIISQMHVKDEPIQYVLTLITLMDEDAFEYRQSVILDLTADLEEVLRLLYNRTT